MSGSNGSRTYAAALDFRGAADHAITLDPDRRFPDRNPADNVWPRHAVAPEHPGVAGNLERAALQ